MKNILLPTDFSENSWNAIEYAIKFFENLTCNFFLLHVNTPSSIVLNDLPYITTSDTIENIYTKPVKQQIRLILKRISKQFKENKKHKFYTLLDDNFFIESIRKCVDDNKISMIVMGTKGASGIKKIIVGTNTGNVITKVKCTTLAVPENAKFNKIKEIAFPTDFSITNDLEALQPISNILDNYNCSLRIVNTGKKKEELNLDQIKNKEILEDYFIHYNYSFHYLKNKKVEDAIQCFVESRDIDMICMVAKNLNYFQHILFHSKVEQISYHTEIPFLVLHEKK